MIRAARMGMEEIEAIARAIVERFHPRRVVLFGSYARGDARGDSDVDLLVEMETAATPPRSGRSRSADSSAGVDSRWMLWSTHRRKSSGCGPSPERCCRSSKRKGGSCMSGPE